MLIFSGFERNILQEIYLPYDKSPTYLKIHKINLLRFIVQQSEIKSSAFPI